MSRVNTSQILTGVNISSESISIPLSAIGLNQELASNSANLKKALDSVYFEKISGLVAVARPTNFTISKSDSVVLLNGELREQFISTFNLAPIDIGLAKLIPETPSVPSSLPSFLQTDRGEFLVTDKEELILIG